MFYIFHVPNVSCVTFFKIFMLMCPYRVTYPCLCFLNYLCNVNPNPSKVVYWTSNKCLEMMLGFCNCNSVWQNSFSCNFIRSFVSVRMWVFRYESNPNCAYTEEFVILKLSCLPLRWLCTERPPKPKLFDRSSGYLCARWIRTSSISACKLNFWKRCFAARVVKCALKWSAYMFCTAFTHTARAVKCALE